MGSMKTTSFVIDEDEDLDIEELVVNIKRAWKKSGRPSHPINKSEVIRAMLRVALVGGTDAIMTQMDQIAQERRKAIENATQEATGSESAGQDGTAVNPAAGGSKETPAT